MSIKEFDLEGLLREALKQQTRPDACYYCGVPAAGIDHLPPRSVRGFLTDEEINTFTFEEITCCNECNSLLGAGYPWAKEERKIKVKEVLRKRYAKELRMKLFSAKELADFGPNLRAAIKSSLYIKSIIEQRLKW